jgi:hypothetical protein
MTLSAAVRRNKLPRHFTGLIPSIYPIDRSFDLYSYCTKVSLVVLPLDVLNLCVLQGIVLLRKYVHKSYTYIPRSDPRGNWKQTYLLYYMLHILITFCVIICKLCNSSRRHQILSPYYTYYNDMILFKIQVTRSHLRPNNTERCKRKMMIINLKR